MYPRPQKLGQTALTSAHIDDGNAPGELGDAFPEAEGVEDGIGRRQLLGTKGGWHAVARAQQQDRQAWVARSSSEFPDAN